MVPEFCPGCGSPLSEGFKICPRCGRVVQAAEVRQGRPVRRNAERPQSAVTYGQGREVQRRPQPRRQYDGSAPRSQSQQRIPQRSYNNEQHRAQRTEHPSVQTDRKSGLKSFLGTSSKVLRIVFNTLKIAMLVAVIYIGIFLIQVYRIKLSPYPYSTNMRLSSSNFGQAISGYFDSGKWSVNPISGKCTYTGTTRHREDMTLVFSAGTKIEVTEITVDGEPLSERSLENKVMGMFI